MNRQLVDDEASCNPMSFAELERRMRGWLEEGWQAVVFEREGEPVGYVLFQFRSDEYAPSEAAIYVRQSFIERKYRSQGIGRRAFEIVSGTYFRDALSVVLDVLETNPRARR